MQAGNVAGTGEAESRGLKGSRLPGEAPGTKATKATMAEPEARPDTGLETGLETGPETGLLGRAASTAALSDATKGS